MVPGLRHLPAATVGLIGLLNPATGVLLGTAIAGEALTIQQICGLALVFTGICLGQRIASRRTFRRVLGESPARTLRTQRQLDNLPQCPH